MLFDITRARIADFISPESAQRRHNALIAAFVDPLTHIGNRRALDAALPQALSQGFVIVLFDINSFKIINDSLGHETGDHLLRTVAESLTCTAHEFHSLRIFRLGGDEFVCLIPSNKAQIFRDTAELRLDQLIAHVPKITQLGVGISGGIGSTIKEADTAMYSRKQLRKQHNTQLAQENLYATNKITSLAA